MPVKSDEVCCNLTNLFITTHESQALFLWRLFMIVSCPVCMPKTKANSWNTPAFWEGAEVLGLGEHFLYMGFERWHFGIDVLSWDFTPDLKDTSLKRTSFLMSYLSVLLYLQANESPEPTFDLSECELSEVPEGVFSTCKVLQKEVSPYSFIV